MSLDLLEIGNLNKKLKNIARVADFERISQTLSNESDLVKALNITKLESSKVGQSINGIKVVSESLPEAKETIAKLTAAPPIVETTDKIPGLEDKIKKPLTDSEKTLIQQMSGQPWTNPDTGKVFTPKASYDNKIRGLVRSNKFVGTPVSIQSNITKIVNEVPNFNNIIKDIIPDGFENIAENGLQRVLELENAANELNLNLTSGLNLLSEIPSELLSLTDGLGGLTGVFNNDVDKAISDINSNINSVVKIDNTLNIPLGILQDIKITELNHLKVGLDRVAGNIISEKDKINLIRQLKQEQFNSVINTIQNAALSKGKLEDVLRIDVTTLENTISSLSTDLATNIKKESVVRKPTSKITAVGTQGDLWNGANTAISLNRNAITSDKSEYSFERVMTYEELVAELNAVKREVTEVIVHWSGHFLDQSHAGAEEVHRRNIALNLEGCAYHYIIKKNGHLERGRPIEIPGQHAADHNKYSIGLCFIGGMNSYSTDDPHEYKEGVESLTEAQDESFEMFMKAYYSIWPGGSAFGHNDIEDWARDPGFDVQQYVKNKFKKINQANPTESELSQEDLVKEPMMSTDAITEYNEADTRLVVSNAKVPPVAESVQNKTGTILPGKVPIPVDSYNHIAYLLNSGLVNPDDIFKSTLNQEDKILTAVINDEKRIQFKSLGFSDAEAKRKAIEIKNELNELITAQTFI